MTLTNQNLDTLGTLLDRRRAIAEALKAQCSTQGGYCARCAFPFALDPPHNVGLNRPIRKPDPGPPSAANAIGFFFLCETCWRMCSEVERIDYFRAVYKHSWSKDYTSKISLEEYEDAVRAASKAA